LALRLSEGLGRSDGYARQVEAVAAHQELGNEALTGDCVYRAIVPSIMKKSRGAKAQPSNAAATQNDRAHADRPVDARKTTQAAPIPKSAPLGIRITRSSMPMCHVL
jgi:hypothetical protein